MKIKYYKQKVRADGSINHLIQVTDKIKEKTQLASKSFPTLAAAKAYSLKVQERDANYSIAQRAEVIEKSMTVGELVEAYYNTEAFFNLKTNSRSSYDLMIRTAFNPLSEFSKDSLEPMLTDSITKPVAQKFITAIRNKYGQHRAVHVTKVMRVVWSEGERQGWVTSNPWRNSRLKQPASRTVEWTKDQVDTFVYTADEMGLHSIGTMALMCLHLCQRPGDVRAMRWHHIEDMVFTFTQEKTGTSVDIPISKPLEQRFIDMYAFLPSENVNRHILISEITGRPYTDQFFYGKLARRVMNKANLPKDLRMGDLRRTGATILAKSGATEDELMSVTGHKSREIVSTYVNKSAALANSAIQKAWG